MSAAVSSYDSPWVVDGIAFTVLWIDDAAAGRENNIIWHANLPSGTQKKYSTPMTNITHANKLVPRNQLLLETLLVERADGQRGHKGAVRDDGLSDGEGINVIVHPRLSANL